MSKTHHSIGIKWEESAVRKVVTISGRLDSDATLSVLLLDGKGKLWMKKKVKEKAGDLNVDFRIPKLKPGQYHLWVTLDDHVEIHPLAIEGRVGKGWLGQLRQLFFL